MAESQRLWKQNYYDKGGPRAYTYVRARDVANDRIEFTVISVTKGNVVERAFIIGQPMESVPSGDSLRLQEAWDETGMSLGTHAEGAPIKTIDELYAECDVLLTKVPEAAQVRMYFDSQGILQHCGTLSEDAAYPAVSIQRIGKWAMGRRWSLALLCSRPEGLYFTDEVAPDGRTCLGGYLDKPTAAKPDYSGCPQEVLDCLTNPTGRGPMGDPCDILHEQFPHCETQYYNYCEEYPDFCTNHITAEWFCRYSSSCSALIKPVLPLQPLEVGKASPNAAWHPPALPQCQSACRDEINLR